jgi:hypothetical protein
MVAVKTYEVTATREGRWWLVRVPVIDSVTQARHIGEVEEMARSLIHVMTDEDPAAFGLRITVEGMGDILDRLAAADAAAAEAQKQATEVRKEAARRAVEGAGLSLREAGAVLGVSFQRVAQLLGDRKTARG